MVADSIMMCPTFICSIPLVMDHELCSWPQDVILLSEMGDQYQKSKYQESICIMTLEYANWRLKSISTQRSCLMPWQSYQKGLSNNSWKLKHCSWDLEQISLYRVCNTVMNENNAHFLPQFVDFWYWRIPCHPQIQSFNEAIMQE